MQEKNVPLKEKLLVPNAYFKRMAMAEKNVPAKEKLLLHWEYFKRSEAYRKVNERLEPFGHPGLLKGEKRRSWNEAILALREDKELKIALVTYLLFNREYWGESFDVFSEREVGKLIVEDISEKISHLFDCFMMAQYKELRDSNEDCTIPNEEINDEYIDELYGDIVIRIDGLEFADAKNLEKEIRKIIANKKKEILSRKDSFLVPPRKLRYGEVKRYLEVYDKVTSFKAEGMTWDKITSEFYPQSAKELKDPNIPIKKYDRLMSRMESHKRRLQMEFKKATKIIKNTEKGIFPGPY